MARNLYALYLHAYMLEKGALTLKSFANRKHCTFKLKILFFSNKLVSKDQSQKNERLLELIST